MPDREHYHHQHDLAAGDRPRGARSAKKFFDWYGAVFAPALSAREKSLIASRRSRHSVPYCIDAYAKDALEKGSNIDQMTEATRVGGDPRGRRSAHAVQMLNRVDDLGM
jgi:4-carboxymuconolactone decarboxylase